MKICFSLFIPCAIFLFSLLGVGERKFGVVETIQGIPYPKTGENIVILEDMAHADLFLQEPVLGKQAVITVSFDPGESDTISLGVRENEFWLSYVQYPLYTKGIDKLGEQTKKIAIPLSTALQDKDRSIDLMFFTVNTVGEPQWSLKTFHASLEFDMPSPAETKAYIKSIVTRERAL